MKIVSMEPTPSPYSLKVNVDQALQNGEAYNYTKQDNIGDAPTYIQQLLQIEGVKGIYRVVDFITLERNPRVEWEDILPQVVELLGTDQPMEQLFSHAALGEEDASYGEIKVEFQMIRNIPTQVKLTEGEVEKRFGLSERLMNAAMEAASESNSYLLERKWVEQAPRYGEIDEIGAQIVAEMDAAFTNERLNELLEAAKKNELPSEHFRQEVSLEMLDQKEWRDRYAVLANMPDPTEKDYPLLNKALDDEHSSVRRIATAYLGMIEQKETLPYLYKALRDPSVNVRRTAGDCISDLGFIEAIPEMIQLLEDASRIVRWRAAMFLFEVGDETAIPSLEKALEDPEFEVRMQAKMALERITSGKAGEGSIWQQMEEAVRKK